MTQEALRWIGNGLLIWCALAGTASVLVHLRVYDRTSQMSRHLLIYMTALALTLDLGIIRMALGDTWWFALIRMIVFVAVPLAMTQRLWIQIRAQREARDRMSE